MRPALSFNAAVWGLFAALFSYVLLRAIFVDPLHDEVATYLHYIETGAILGDNALLDANNHLLNSLWGRWMYLWFGNHLFLFRLANVLAFAVYFRACVSLSQELRLPAKRLLFIAALTCVPYLLDYFSYARGYGMALGFFFGALALWRYWMQTFRPAAQWAAYALLLLAVSSSLIYLVSACLLLCCFLCAQFLRIRQFSIREQLLQLLAHVGFLIALWPLIRHSLQLKDGGALYYGSLDGFWQVTGKSLSTYVLFCNGDFLKWFFIAFGVVLIGVALRYWWKNGLQSALSTAAFTLIVFLAGNACAVLILAKGLGVNYPEDRAGMYFVPLGIAALAFVLLSGRNWKWYGWPLLFFPVSLIATLNLHTSVFSPDDRMQESFYRDVRSELQPEDILCVDPIQQITWARFEQLYHDEPHFAIARRGIEAEYDVIVTKTAFPLPAALRPKYRVIACDPSNGFIAYRHIRRVRNPLFRVSLPADYSGNDAEIVLLQDTVVPVFRNIPLSLRISGILETDTCYRDLQLVVATTDSTGTTIIRADAFNFRWYFGEKRRRFSYTFPYKPSAFSDREVELKVYIWNPEKRRIRNRGSRIEWNCY